MPYEITVKRGDLHPDVELTVTDDLGAVVDITGAGVKFSMCSARDPSVNVVDAQDGVLVTAALGKIAYRWKALETDLEPGTYEGEFTIDPVVGDTIQVPTIGKILIYIERRV